MKTLWAFIGQALFWLSWPAVAFVMPYTRRSRVLVMHKGKILLVKSWYGSGEWTLPGGGIKQGETPVMAAKRELAEETGLVPKTFKKLGQATQKHHGLTMHYYQFMVQPEGDIVQPRPPKPVISAYVWASPTKLPSRTQPHVTQSYQTWQAKQ